MKLRIVLSALFVLVLTSPVVLVAATETSTTERSFPAPEKVTVNASFHRVEVVAKSGGDVDVTIDLEFTASKSKAAKLLEEFKPRFEISSDHAVISSVGKSSKWGWGSEKKKGNIRLAVPPGVDLFIDSSSGSVHLDGDFQDANVSVDNSSGSVKGEAALASLTVDNSSGSTHFTALRPLESFSVDCSSGSVRLEGGARKVSVDASSGSVRLYDLLGPLDVDTSSGSIEAGWASIAPDTTIDVSASSGGVRLTFPSGTDLSGTVQTSSGGIRTDFPGTMNERKNNLDLRGGPGAVRLDVSTSSGGVKLISG